VSEWGCGGTRGAAALVGMVGARVAHRDRAYFLTGSESVRKLNWIVSPGPLRGWATSPWVRIQADSSMPVLFSIR